MSDVAVLIDQGETRIQLPHWRHAYVSLRPEGPWADLYDIGAGIGSGEPVAVLIATCAQDDRWIPASAPEANENADV